MASSSTGTGNQIPSRVGEMSIRGNPSTASSSTGTGNQIPSPSSELSSRGNPVENASPLPCIYKVPSILRVAGADKFEPRVISIGPYHRDMENLVVTKYIKELFVQSFTSRITKSSPTGTTERGTFLQMWNAIGSRQAEYLDYYSPKPVMSTKDFVEMLINDGCFILELLYRYQLDEMKHTDILFQNKWIMPCLHLDLILLENQIPFSVLECLFELVPKLKNNQTTQTYSLKELVLDFLDPISPSIDNSSIDSSRTDRHFLDLLRTHLIHEDGNQVNHDIGEHDTWEYTTCATDLRNAGVTFKKKKTIGLLDIEFSNGTLEIPPFYFGKSWAILFSNLIALEQCNKDYSDKITSYAFLMDNLINSTDDVKLLRDKGIIDGSKEEDETIAHTVNNLCKEVVSEKFYYDGVCNRLNVHRKKWQNQWRAQFFQNYIHTPWAGVSLASVSFLLFLSVIQTVFGILSWLLALHGTYKKNK